MPQESEGMTYFECQEFAYHLGLNPTVFHDSIKIVNDKDAGWYVDFETKGCSWEGYDD